MNEPNRVQPPAWKTGIKRFLMGGLWFLLLWIGARMILGAVIGAVAGAHATGGYSGGYNAGQTAALDFFQKYGLLVMLGALAAAVAGTLTGFLPGTRRPRPHMPGSTPPPGGQWPPPPNFPNT